MPPQAAFALRSTPLTSQQVHSTLRHARAGHTEYLYCHAGVSRRLSSIAAHDGSHFCIRESSERRGRWLQQTRGSSSAREPQTKPCTFGDCPLYSGLSQGYPAGCWLQALGCTQGTCLPVFRVNNSGVAKQSACAPAAALTLPETTDTDCICSSQWRLPLQRVFTLCCTENWLCC